MSSPTPLTNLRRQITRQMAERRARRPHVDIDLLVDAARDLQNLTCLRGADIDALNAAKELIDNTLTRLEAA